MTMREARLGQVAADSDERLMVRVAAGEMAALGELADRHKHGLVNYLTRLTGSPDRGEDLAQETFLRLFRAAPRYRSEGRFHAYLYRIATNLARSEQRREKRWRRRLAVLISGNGHQAEPAAPTGLLRTEAQRLVSAAVAGLPLRYRVPLVLHELEGWPYQAIADLLSLAEGTVKSRISRARGRLRQQLAPYWNGDAT